jgi:hypothetical protein
MRAAITPGQVWLETDGKRIDVLDWHDERRIEDFA